MLVIQAPLSGIGDGPGVEGGRLDEVVGGGGGICPSFSMEKRPRSSRNETQKSTSCWHGTKALFCSCSVVGNGSQGYNDTRFPDLVEE